MIFSHSSAFDIHCNHGRNVPDSVLKQMVCYIVVLEFHVVFIIFDSVVESEDHKEPKDRLDL